MKVVTTFAALEILGPTYRPSTKLVASATQSHGTLEGTFALVGGGSVDFDFDALGRMLSRLRQAGVDTLRGDLLLDRSLFSPQRTDIGTPHFDSSPEFRYNVVPDALLLNQNVLSYRIASDALTVRTTIWPPVPGVEIETNLTLIDAACKDWEDGWKIPETRKNGETISVRMHGTFPRHCVQTQELNVIDRDDLIERAFRLTWGRLGGRWEGRAHVGHAPTGARVLAESFGRSVGELAVAVNKSSDNAHARVLFNLLGAKARAIDETSFAASERVIRTWLRTHGVDDRGFVFENGSGLSRIEKIPTAQLATLLARARSSPWAPEFLASLPLAGMDGTMRNRLKDSPARGQARMKTGTLRDVVSLAGYMNDATGAPYIVVAFVNHPRATHDVARPIVDALVDWVARTDLSKPLEYSRVR
jgi:D-alanyl-D-alanine carboxypeptidase/D-alanyl-D-alanine-endopeptidase (penicillin-binding protein 4)